MSRYIIKSRSTHRAGLAVCGFSKEESFEIKGVEVWNQQGQEAHVHEPVYGKEFIFEVFSIWDGYQKLSLQPENLNPAGGDFV